MLFLTSNSLGNVVMIYYRMLFMLGILPYSAQARGFMPGSEVVTETAGWIDSEVVRLKPCLHGTDNPDRSRSVSGYKSTSCVNGCSPKWTDLD